MQKSQILGKVIPKGGIIQIICKNNEQAIKLENVMNYGQSKINASPINSQDVTQLWFIDKINNGKDYQIVNALSGYVFEQGSQVIHLSKGNWSKGQAYKIQKAPIDGFYVYYWIKLSKNQNKAVCLQGILRCVDFNQNDQKQLFRFQRVQNNATVNRSVVIMNSKSDRRVLDIPGGSDKQGQQIIQYQYNNRFNQRWILVKTGASNIYQIQSFKTGYNLDIYGENTKNGTKVIQYRRTAASNQLWALQHKGNSNYIIQSIHSADLYLASQNSSVKDGAKIIVSNTPTIWTIIGSF